MSRRGTENLHCYLAHLKWYREPGHFPSLLHVTPSADRSRWAGMVPKTCIVASRINSVIIIMIIMDRSFYTNPGTRSALLPATQRSLDTALVPRNQGAEKLLGSKRGPGTDNQFYQCHQARRLGTILERRRRRKHGPFQPDKGEKQGNVPIGWSLSKRWNEYIDLKTFFWQHFKQRMYQFCLY